jgi:hypothetical protein
MPAIRWIEARQQKPPVKERLLLMLADAQMIGKSDVEVGYWDGDQFRFTRGQQDIAHLVTRRALLKPGLPKERKSTKASKSG